MSNADSAGVISFFITLCRVPQMVYESIQGVITTTGTQTATLGQIWVSSVQPPPNQMQVRENVCKYRIICSESMKTLVMVITPE